MRIKTSRLKIWILLGSSFLLSPKLSAFNYPDGQKIEAYTAALKKPGKVVLNVLPCREDFPNSEEKTILRENLSLSINLSEEDTAEPALRSEEHTSELQSRN